MTLQPNKKQTETQKYPCRTHIISVIILWIVVTSVFSLLIASGAGRESGAGVFMMFSSVGIVIGILNIIYAAIFKFEYQRDVLRFSMFITILFAIVVIFFFGMPIYYSENISILKIGLTLSPYILGIFIITLIINFFAYLIQRARKK